MPLLAPSLRGPLTPLTDFIEVEGVLPDAKVNLFVNDKLVGPVGFVAHSTLVRFPLRFNPLPPGGVVTALWYLDGETSPHSRPEIVVGFPTSLATPKFSSPIHTEMDWVALDGLYPGATIEVIGPAGPAGSPYTVAQSSTRFYLNTTIAPGDELTATQTVTTPTGEIVQSARAISLPAENWYQDPPTPEIVGPVRECAGVIQVRGAVPGTTLHVHGPEPEPFSFGATGHNVLLTLPGPVHAPDTLAVSTHFERVNRQSGTSAPMGVTTGIPLTTPSLDWPSYACPDTGAVTASGLTENAEITLELRTGSTVTVLGRAGVAPGTTSRDLPLPYLTTLVPGEPPSYLVLREKLCKQTIESAPRRIVFAYPDSAALTTPGVLPPLACSMWLYVNNWVSAWLVARSDSEDWPVLSSPTFMTYHDHWLRLNRPLRAGENVWVTVESGCMPADRRESSHEPVGALPDLDANITIRAPNRPSQHAVVFVNAVSGATVHVFVNGKWRASREWRNLFDFVSVGALNDDDLLTARQSACGGNGEATSPPERVRWGHLALTAEPATLTPTERNIVKFHARDIELGEPRFWLPVTGPGGAVVGKTEETLSLDFLPTTPSPVHFEVTGDGYLPSQVDIPIAGPPPPTPADLKIVLTLSLGQSQQAINKIDWTLLGAGSQINMSDAPNKAVSNVAVNIPHPAGKSEIYNLSGVAAISYTHPITGDLVKQPVNKFKVLGPAGTPVLAGSIMVDWRGYGIIVEIGIGYQYPDFYFVLNRISP